MQSPIARTWYETESFSDGVTLIRETHVARWLRCNIWHVKGRDRDLMIDTGMGVRPLLREVSLLAGRPVTAIATHTHFDHSGGLHEFSDRRGHRLEAGITARPDAQSTAADGGFIRAETFLALPYEGFDWRTFEVRPAAFTGLLEDGDVIDLGDRHFRVLHLPGHSPGSIALYEEQTQILFSGDVVYDGALFDDVYHSDPAVFRRSLARLRDLPVSAVHGGHYASFGRETMRTIIEEYLSGGRRLGDVEAWIRGEIAKGQ